MTQRRLGQIDMSTGEVLEDGFVAYVAPKRKNGFGTGWVAMAQSAMDLLAESNLGAQDWNVLAKLISRLDFENLLVLNQAELARDLKMQRQNVQRSIRTLVSIGVLLEGPRIGISRSYRMNPNFGWKGSARGHVVALDQLRQDRMKAARIDGVVQGGKPDQAEEQPRDTKTGDLFEA